MEEPQHDYENLKLPPLRIHHLMEWMAVTAVLISVSLWFDRTVRNGPPIRDRLVVGSLILGAIALAGALTIALYGPHWRVQGYRFPSQPGEYLVLLVAHTSLAFLAAFVGVFAAFFIEDDLLAVYGPAACLLLFPYWVFMNVRGMTICADTSSWRWVFGSLIVAALATLGMALPIVGFLVCLTYACGLDLRSRIERGWIHWLGVALAVAVACAMMGIIVGARW